MTGRRIFELNLDGRKLIVETGHVAKQANGAAIIKYEDTGVLSVVAASKEPTTLPFFPLMVIYTEKMYAGGKIPGGFLKREGRPSENETLTSRLIDRPIRPLFADGVRNEIQIINTVMSGNQDNSPEMSAMFGSSLVLGLSDLDFGGPIAGVIVGRVDGEYVLNPTQAQLEVSDIELTVAGTFDAINMVEAGAKEVNEADMLGAIMFGHDWIKKLVTFQNEIIAEVGKEVIPFEIKDIPAEVTARVNELAFDDLVEAVKINEKIARNTAVDVVKDRVKEIYTSENADLTKDELKELLSPVKVALDTIVKEQVRKLITVDKIRPDGRKTDEIRPLESHVDIFDRTHGSAMFTRGQTQALSITTLGSIRDHQIMDGIGEKEYKRFMLHYNFPAYSVGETGRYMSAGRREIGHGALGERALKQVMPNEDDFPYTVRIVSEILESNGSTSQASICAGCMSLMAAGVPITAPVAGIAMGLIKTGEDYSILSDIQGMEDHLGDMDFKVAGTAKGITALQMDIKIDGLSEEILKEALDQAKIGRLHILENMIAAISEPRTEVSKYAPKVKLMIISPDKIRAVIGPGGKSITAIIEQCNDVKIDIEQDGHVTIMHTDSAVINKAVGLIEEIIREAKVGEVYSGKVVRVEKFGCFVELWKGTDGLCHISKLAHERVNQTEDVVSIGDIINVKVIGIDDKGRIDLSRKALLKRPAPTPRPEVKKEEVKK